MSFGKLHTYEGNARTIPILAVAKANKLEVEIVEASPKKGLTKEYLALNPIGKIPAFEGSDGYVLTEAIAIAIYFTSQNEKTPLLGKTKQDYASILRWMSFANSEILPPLSAWFAPLIGRDPYNKKSVDDNQKACLRAVDALEKHLQVHTYLVGERLTLADIFAAGAVSRGFQYVFDKNFRQNHPNVTRWFQTVGNQAIYSDVSKIILVDEAVKYTPPKKEAAPKKETPKAAPKAKAAEVEEDDDEPAPAPKPKHPLEALPKATLVLDDWKRKYSNEETREAALPWFWANFKADEYSLWRVDYKYNDELTQIFMTSNLIGGFFARLEGSRKYIFGSASVYGEANKSVVVGAFVIRGQEALPAFDVAPDYESYAFTKLDPAKKEDREFVEDQWAWDKPVTVAEKEYPWADGKVFK
ncbi:MAG: hypothetical protein M1832_005820 [Thelocarpon impressellum]|nr:MAG: hypothetical protein M1832_005820 [Thelocarpon impressellum]